MNCAIKMSIYHVDTLTLQLLLANEYKYLEDIYIAIVRSLRKVSHLLVTKQQK